MRRKNTDQASQPITAPREPSLGSVHRRIRWERLDNTAHMFPVIASEQTSNVFRISVTLHETVDPELLQQALDIVLPKFDGFNVRLRNGIFWNYFEENGKPAPRVRLEKGFPCRFFRPGGNNSYLFRVSYFQYRINLEVFHVLADGMGAINFLKELTYQYLRLKHEDLAGTCADGLDHKTTLNLEDSFLKHCKKAAPIKYAVDPAYLIKGEKLSTGEFGVMHGYLKISELKPLCRSLGLTINEYLVSVYAWSIYTEYLRGGKSSLPVRIAVPVNLRPFFNSITTRNFFAIISAEFRVEEESYTFEDVCRIIQRSLREQLRVDHLEEIFSYNVSCQQNPLLKILPLPIKHLGMRFIYGRSALANTSTVSNVGKIEVDDPYKPYIDQFHVFMAVSKGQHIKGTICSYEDTLVFTFSYDLADTSLQRGFFRKLVEDGLHVEVESNGVHYG
jgi:NRPS condensation-like uncharacterized protein